MKPSFYNIEVPSEQHDQVAIFNTLYGSMALLSKDEYRESKPVLEGRTESSEDPELIRQLCSLRMLINDDEDELSLLHERKKAGIEDPNRLDVIVMPTLECNFSCKYCYEERRPGRMAPETVEALKLWLEHEIPNRKLIMLYWFGGEPLIAADYVVDVTAASMKYAAQSGVSIIPHITTNGYLLNRSLADRLVSTGILSYQITIDGARPHHNRLRPLRNGRPTFDRILQNVCHLALLDERVKVSVRVNFNHTNIHTIPELLVTFPPAVRPHIRIVFEPIFGSCAISATDNIDSASIASSLGEYYQKASELGFDVVFGHAGLQPGRMVYCYAERAQQMVIGVDGNIFKCSVCTFTESDRVGQLSPTGHLIRNERWDMWTGAPLFDEPCSTCKYLPLCMGGCRKARMERHETGSYCSLVPTNAAYVLKQIAFHRFEGLILNSAKAGEGAP